jgi:hypothetical protein
MTHTARREGMKACLGKMKKRHYLENVNRWQTIIKMYRKEIGWEGLGLSQSEQGKLAGSFTHRNEHSGPIEIPEVSWLTEEPLAYQERLLQGVSFMKISHNL